MSCRRKSLEPSGPGLRPCYMMKEALRAQPQDCLTFFLGGGGLYLKAYGILVFRLGIEPVPLSVEVSTTELPGKPLFYFLAMPCGLWNLSSLIRD